MPGYLNKLSNYFIKILHFQKPKPKKLFIVPQRIINIVFVSFKDY